MQWEIVIGLEIHAQLATKSKMFSGAAIGYGAEPNTQACAIDIGLPGTLPVINQQAIEMAIKFGLATNGKIAEKSVFARKNYFYPDLPKGYQISQLDLPIISNGYIEIELPGHNKKNIGITRAHLEEDAGKSIHNLSRHTNVDLNRAGTPLIEIVSEPDMRSAREAVIYMKKIHSIVKYLKICDGNMQEGSFRCDANVSVKPADSEHMGTRTEIKNLNSFKFIEQAIIYEAERQIDMITLGQQVLQETRLYDPDSNKTRAMRSKEEANDYRYFPDPDLLPVYLDQETIESIRRTLPELPDAKYQRFINEYSLSEYDSQFLTSTLEQAEYFERVVCAIGGEAKLSANWIMGELSAFLNKNNQDISDSPVTAEMLATLIQRIKDNTISNKIAKQVFEAMWNSGNSADEIIENKNLNQVTDINTIERMVDDVIANNPDQVQQYYDSNTDKKSKLISFLVGQIMKQSRGTASPKQVNQLLHEKLKQ